MYSWTAFSMRSERLPFSPTILSSCSSRLVESVIDVLLFILPSILLMLIQLIHAGPCTSFTSADDNGPLYYADDPSANDIGPLYYADDLSAVTPKWKNLRRRHNRSQ